MIEPVLHWVETLAGSPIYQALLAALGTLIMEDPTSIGCGLLVAAGEMNFISAYLGVSLGITVGDLALYLLGRFLSPMAIRIGLVRRGGLKKAKKMFDRNLIFAVLASRFLPGMRLPTYVAAGMAKASARKFMAIALLASLFWTMLLMTLAIRVGERVGPMLGHYRLPVGAGFVALLVLVQVLVIRRHRRRMRELEAENGGDADPTPDEAGSYSA